jgi:NitT/TauT family transport system ATP-binding protein
MHDAVAPVMTAPKLELQGVRITFAGEEGPFDVVRDLSLRVESGQFAAVVGTSGSGKTTLLRSVDGLLRPAAGEILISGEPVRGPGLSRALVFQRDCLLPWRNVLDNVTLSLRLRGVARAERTAAGMELIRLVGLRGFERHFPYQLSGGMRQRVNLARALAADPDVLLMDEPFAALDAQTREVMQLELLRVWWQTRKTVLFVTHQIDEAVYLSDRVLVLSARPARIREDIEVPFPRPRTLSLKRSPQFAALVDRIWNLIESDVMAVNAGSPPQHG